jgi:hypothetical protein
MHKVIQSDVSLIIKTFERQEALERMITSIRTQGYADCPVLIADDSKVPYRDIIIEKYGDIVDEYVVLPFNSGLSKGRNELLNRVETKYFVLNDDDFVYDERTDLAWMHDQLESTDIELLGGLFYDQRTYVPKPNASIFRRAWYRLLREIGAKREFIRRYHGAVRTDGDTIVMEPVEYCAPVTRCDYTHNFFMADTQAVREKVGGWRDEIKTSWEHWEFFYRAKQAGLRVATTEEVGVSHEDPGDSDRYKTHRMDKADYYQRLSMQEHGFNTMRWYATAFENPTWKEFSIE